MNGLAKYLAASSVMIGLGIGAAWAADATTPQQKAPQQKARDQKAATTPAKTDLHAEIASPITGEFAAGAQMSWGTAPDVGGYNGSGFLSPTGQPSSEPSGTPGNPGPSF